MHATLKASPNATVVRLENGVTVDIRTRYVETWAPGALRLYRGTLSDINLALSIGASWQPPTP